MFRRVVVRASRLPHPDPGADTNAFRQESGMPFHNPFIKDGRITFPEGASLVKHVERWAKVRGDKLAYRFPRFLDRTRRRGP